MKAEFRSRPESKRMKKEVRPSTSKHINTQQAAVTFKQAKEEQAQHLFQKAIDLYLRATIYDPNYYQAFCNIGSCYRSLGQYMEARRFYRKAISIKKDDAISHYNLANAERVIGDLQAAIEHYLFVIREKEQKKVEVGSLYINSLINLGICYKNKQLYDRANQCYQKALKMDGKEETALYNYGMSIVNSLKKLNIQIFQQVAKEKAQKALQIFTKYLEIYKVNEMAEFQILRMSCMVDKSSENIAKTIEKLKKMLKASNCSIADQINMELGYLSGLLKDYEKAAAHYQKSMSGFNQKKKESQTPREQNIYDSSNGFTSKPMLKKAKPVTQEEGLRMIEDGVLQQLQQQIQKLQDSDQTRHVLSLALQLAKVQRNQGNIQSAANIYQKYFKKSGAEIANDQISIEGHKAIGKLLALQQKYKESIAHFEYISTRINSKEEKSKVHSSLANDYEALGQKSMALKQYEMALNSEPDNYELLYNMGCLLHDDMQYEQAFEYFSKFLEQIQKDYSLDLTKKSIYITDCLITMAQCKSQIEVNKLRLYDIYMKAWVALKELDVEGDQFQFEQSKIMSFFLGLAEILEEKLANCKNRRSEEFISTKQKLLQVYMSLLQNNACPDRDAILNNCATIYYEERLYVNTIANYNMISSPTNLSYNNLALTYLHLREHFMANKLIFLAVDDESVDKVEKFNKQVISWIYGLSQQGKLYQRFKNYSDQALASRLEYGLYMLDALTSKLNELPDQHLMSDIDQIIDNLQQSEFLGQFFDEGEHSKLKALVKVLNQRQASAVDSVDSNYLVSVLQKGSNYQQEFTALLKQLANQGDKTTQTVLQLFINLFIFNNRQHASNLRSILHKFDQQHVQHLALNLDRRVTITSDLLVRSFGKKSGIRNIGDLVENIIMWECELESKLVVLIKTIEKYYYKSKIRRPLQIEYHFPRHVEWEECASTFMKIMFVITEGLKIQPKCQIKGKNLNDAKYKMLAQVQEDLVKKVNLKDEIKVILGDKFVPVTVFTYHESKKDCLQFLKDLQKESSDKREIQLGKDCKQAIVQVSDILRLKCVWDEPTPFYNSIKSYTQHSIPIEIQALVSLQSELYILKESSPKNKDILQQIEMFRE